MAAPPKFGPGSPWASAHAAVKAKGKSKKKGGGTGAKKAGGKGGGS